jgi:hypothetical protein
MARRKKFRLPGVSFSAKRALGITQAKQRLARKTGIPTTKAGLRRKVGKAATGGCLLPVLGAAAIAVGIISAAVAVTKAM